jgi:ribosomal protein S6--L-glutamate ligase
MILSFHPLFVADQNIICAGRSPGPDDARAAAEAEATILPQGCRRDLYEMVRQNCPLVFPNYDARFAYQGKMGQITLFKRVGVPYPASILFTDTGAFHHRIKRLPDDLPFKLPCVFKFDWGGGGETVYPIDTESRLMALIESAATFESSGQKGFLIQEMITAGSRSLRVVVIGQQYLSYWRVQPESGGFWTGLAQGARIDAAADPGLQAQAVTAVRNFCRITGINLAGFDILFADTTTTPQMYFLEINFFFGRHGLGGSDAYYRILIREIDNWLNDNGLIPAKALLI